MRAVAAIVILAVVIAAVALLPRRTVRRLPPGVTELHSEMVVETDLEGDPAGSTLRIADDFAGRAAIVVNSGGLRLRSFLVVGNRQTREPRVGLPPYDVPFARFTTGNGILIDGAAGVRIDHVQFREIAGFAILVHSGQQIAVDQVQLRDSGSRNPEGKNNTTGGILFEAGTTDFRVTNSSFVNIRGNGVWTHSLYTAPRNFRGLFAGNSFDTIGRDALQAGHAIELRIERNTGVRIGYPREIVDATPVGIDTAGNVERSAYIANRFDTIGGKCIDLDGFHDGDVSGNHCAAVSGFAIVMNNTNPDMQSRNIRVVENTIHSTLYGGIFVIGTGHYIAHNLLTNINVSHCEAAAGCSYMGEPYMLQSGIYLGLRAERPAPAHGNIVEDNQISGYKMAGRCVKAAPGLNDNIIRGNICRDDPTSSPTSTPQSPSRSADPSRP